MAGMVENRWSEMSVGMLSPSSAAEVCRADEGRYNTRAVLSQGAFDVQSIRASQTADPRAKQTHPSGPGRRLAKVNSRPGDGDSIGSMPAGRFHLGEVVESFLSQPLLAGLPLPAAAPPPALTSPGGRTSTPGCPTARTSTSSSVNGRSVATHSAVSSSSEPGEADHIIPQRCGGHHMDNLPLLWARRSLVKRDRYPIS